MLKMEPSVLTRDEMERRRLAAAQALLSGVSQASVARRFGVSRTTASRWQQALSGNGLECLRKRRATGRPNRLTFEQRLGVAEMYAAGPRACGFDADRWTTTRMAHAIAERFGIRYDPDHVGRLMHRLGLRARRAPVVRPERFVETPAGYPTPRYSPNTDFSVSEISPTVQ
jgi:transposase